MRIAEITSTGPLTPVQAQSAALKQQALSLKKQRAALQVRKARERVQQAQRKQAEIAAAHT